MALNSGLGEDVESGFGVGVDVKGLPLQERFFGSWVKTNAAANALRQGARPLTVGSSLFDR